jgi:hypothetical protein
MRFAGPQIYMDPSQMKPTSGRFAGAVAKQNPGLVERITDAIVPGKKAQNTSAAS